MNSYEVEQKLGDLKREMFQKVEKYELEIKLAPIFSSLGVLETSLREILSENDGLRFRVQELEADRIERKEPTHER